MYSFCLYLLGVFMSTLIIFRSLKMSLYFMNNQTYTSFFMYIIYFNFNSMLKKYTNNKFYNLFLSFAQEMPFIESLQVGIGTNNI